MKLATILEFCYETLRAKRQMVSGLHTTIINDANMPALTHPAEL